MKIILTGSEGFIGGHLKKELLFRGHEVSCWDEKINKCASEIFLTPNTAKADYFIHLAAYADVTESMAQPDKYIENNVALTIDIQRYCNTNKIPLLYASSSCIHDWSLSVYGMTKKINELTAYENQIGLRFTTVYGDGARDQMLIGRLIKNEVKYLTNHTRDFVHVADVVSAIMLLLETKQHVDGCYDIGCGFGVKVSNLGIYLGHEDIPITEGEVYEAKDNTANISRMVKLGWSPTIYIYDYLKDYL